MATTHFNITPQDVLDVISLTSTWVQCEEPQLKSYVSPLKIQRIADEAEAQVLCTLPEAYRSKVCGTIGGIIGTQWAQKGQTTVTIPAVFTDIISAVRVYKNFPDQWVGFKHKGQKSYLLRDKTDEYNGTFTLNASIPCIGLDKPLEDGDSIVLDIDYTTSEWVTELVSVTRKLAAYNMLSAMPTMSDNISIRIQQLRSDVFGFTSRLSGDRGGENTSNGLQSIDSLPMIKTERVRVANLGGIAGVFGL